MSTFAAKFREMVVPTLRSEIRKHGFLVALDIVYPGCCEEERGFSSSYEAVWEIAYKRGGAYLPDSIRQDLRDWIAVCLADDIDASEKELRDYQDRMNPVHDDATRWDRMVRRLAQD